MGDREASATPVLWTSHANLAGLTWVERASRVATLIWSEQHSSSVYGMQNKLVRDRTFLHFTTGRETLCYRRGSHPDSLDDVPEAVSHDENAGVVVEKYQAA